MTHGPLRGADVHVDEGEVSAISGWEHAGVADPARDFALLWNSAPQQAFDTVFEAYAAERAERPDPNLERRIRLMGEMELAYALLASRTMGDDARVERALDAVIAALLLALLWPDYQAGRLGARDLETAAFTVFLYGFAIARADGSPRSPGTGDCGSSGGRRR